MSLTKRKARFLAVRGQDPVVVTALSGAVLVRLHWDASAKRSRRCGGRACALCADGVEAQERVYLWVQHRGERYLLMLTAANEEELEAQGVALEDVASLVGTVFELRRESPAYNARQVVRVVDKVEVLPIGAPEAERIGLEPELKGSRLVECIVPEAPRGRGLRRLGQ